MIVDLLWKINVTLIQKKKYRTEDLEKRIDDSEMKLSDTNELVKNRL